MKKQELIKLWWKEQKNFWNALKLQSKLYSPKGIDKSLVEDVFNSSPVFVLSTGRCGTQLLTDLFGLADSVQVEHEPEPELLYPGKYAYEHKNEIKALEALFIGARYERIRNAHIQNKRYIETNNRISFLAEAIANLFPNAKFIHLVRKPEAFIRSGLGRNWYQGANITDEGRIRPADSDFNSWTEADKIAWLWNETNSCIEEFKSKLDSERVMLIRSEDLFSKPEVSEKVFDFLNLKAPLRKDIERIIATPVNKGKSSIKSTIDFNKELVSLRAKYYN